MDPAKRARRRTSPGSIEVKVETHDFVQLGIVGPDLRRGQVEQVSRPYPEGTGQPKEARERDGGRPVLYPGDGLGLQVGGFRDGCLRQAEPISGCPDAGPDLSKKHRVGAAV
jgi:hypothetical protein